MVDKLDNDLRPQRNPVNGSSESVYMEYEKVDFNLTQTNITNVTVNCVG